MNLIPALFLFGLCLRVYADFSIEGTLNTPDGLLEKRREIKLPKLPLISSQNEQQDSSSTREFNNLDEDLKKIKYLILNGQTRLAKNLLTNISFTDSKLRSTINRYLAILSFIDEDYQQTYDYLSIKELQNFPEFGKICVLKTLTEVVLNKLNSLGDTWSKCKINNARYLDEDHLIWPEMIVEFKLNPKGGMTQIPFKQYRLNLLSNEDTKIILKIALYLNQEDLVINQLPELTIPQLRDQEIRELAGQIFFKKGYLQKSYNFIEDLNSPNSENIKGNLHLLRGQFEDAYRQFKLALKQRPNSQNALERLLPLAWVLGDWEYATNYAHELQSTSESLVNKLTLLSAFSIQKSEYQKSDQYVKKIIATSQKGERLEISQIASFTALMQNEDKERIKRHSRLSCEQNDLINCWMLFQLSQWEDFSSTIKKDEEVVIKKEWELLIKDQINAPLQEKIFINQKDIEELDDKLINLIKNP